MPKWHYHNPVEIHFGLGIINDLPDYVSGKAVLITTPGSSSRGISQIISELLNDSLVAVFEKVEPNPTFETIKVAYRELKQFYYDVIIAVGGGSTIDTAKAVAAMNAAGCENWISDHLKCASPFPLNFDPKPVIAIPTTAGTGSEVTMWATIWDMVDKKKYSLSHPLLYCAIALLDPELTLTLPLKETMYSGLDALSHAMEAIWNKNHNPLSDILALEAILLVHDYLPELERDLSSIDLRAKLLRASLFGGLAFSNTKTALAHSISYPLTGHFGLPHGLACALVLPHILGFNALKAAERIQIIARALRTDTTAESIIGKINSLYEKIGLSPSLVDYGIDRSQIEVIAKSAFTPGRADNNIVEFNENDLFDIIGRLF